jgi:hypothetical protein
LHCSRKPARRILNCYPRDARDTPVSYKQLFMN